MKKQVTAAETGGTQKTVIPKVRYHPSIHTAGDGVQPKTRARPAAQRPPQNGTGSKTVQDADKVDLVPAVRPLLNGGAKQRRGVRKPVQRAATDPDHPQTPNQVLESAPPGLDLLPLGVGDQKDSCTAEEVEVLTRGQRTNPEWFTWRKNRITASVAHSIAHCHFVNGRSKFPPTSYLAAVTGENQRVQTRAMSWGVHMEAEVVQRYQTLKSATLGHPVSVQECGLFIDARRPWLAASPDGIVMDRQTGQRLLCLEVKCPYKHRQRRVEDACRVDTAFCLETLEPDGRHSGEAPAYRLKKSHSYFTQIQCQLAVTGLRQADLVVFTLQETAIVPVTFDPELWEETVSKLQVFYRDAVQPHLREMKRDTGTTWTPEL